jgi:hypothetical protein
MSDSELFQSILNSIQEFNVSDYGIVNVDSEDTKRQVWHLAWIHALSHKIEEDWVKHVDGI